MAFLQYRLDAHAKKAVEHGPGIIISNRPCRVEPGKANREFPLSFFILTFPPSQLQC